jgi:hypothetical protein
MIFNLTVSIRSAQSLAHPKSGTRGRLLLPHAALLAGTPNPSLRPRMGKVRGEDFTGGEIGRAINNIGGSQTIPH